MPGHDVIVLGASAGGVEALSAVIAGLPADLHAAVCVVIHLRPEASSRLAAVLARVTRLPVIPARNRMALRRGVVHVGVPDLHLLIEADGDDGRVRLVRGPRENRTRPAVDPLFRSAALAFGPRVIGVVLSGALDDGTAGLWAVKDRGGIAVVQDPDDAAVPSMPSSALAEVAVDHVAPAREIGPLLGRLAREAAPAQVPVGKQPADELAREVGIAAIDEAAHARSERYGDPSRFTCPDCGGVLWELSGEGPLRFRCEVGHAHSAATLAETQTEAAEAAMWSALRALEDKAELARQRSIAATGRGLAASAALFTAEEQAAQQHAAAIRAVLRLDVRAGNGSRVSTDDELPESERVDANAAVERDVELDGTTAYSASAPRSS
ncbi:MAG: chemotaxis protein CheB [Gemmatimonadetes bacterium]|nr:MAG: chemotaxis protein CheB [Gemmatimonadota bacterium]